MNVRQRSKSQARRRRQQSRIGGDPSYSRSRRLWLEPLEDRRLLAVLTVDSAEDNLESDGQITLREAIVAANNDAVADLIEGVQRGDGADTIRFDPGLAGQTISLSLGELRITSDIAIEGLGESQTVISGLDASRVIRIDNDDPSRVLVSLSALTIRDGYNDATDQEGGPGILNVEDLVLQSVTIEDNHTQSFGDGGGLAVIRGSLTANDITVTNNSATSAGGIYIHDSNATIVDSLIASNTASVGGLEVNCAGFYTVEVINTDIIDNVSTYHGGGAYVRMIVSEFTMTGGSITGNTARERGGGLRLIANALSVITIEGVAVRGNSVDGFSQNFDFGGGISAQASGVGSDRGEIRLSQLDVSSNSAARGGGVELTAFEAGSIYVDSTTISGNTAAVRGGGMLVDSNGNANAGTGRIVLTQTTVSGNTVEHGGLGAGAYIRADLNSEPVEIRHSTIVENDSVDGGGGVHVRDARLMLENSIVAQNSQSSPTPTDILLEGTSTIQARYSLVGTNRGNDLPAMMPDENGNLVGSEAAPLDPLLSSLSLNGGMTATHVPLSTSPVIEVGDPNALLPEFDQRGVGFPRQVGSRVDIGATEFQDALVVDHLSDEQDDDYSAGDLSLREAIALANASPDVAVVLFDPLLVGQSLPVDMGEILIDDSLVIHGPGQDELTIDAGHVSRIFNIDDGDPTFSSVAIRDLTLAQGATATSDGGAIRSRENLRLHGVTIRNSMADRGGGIYAEGELALTTTTIVQNQALTDAGGVLHNGSQLVVSNAVFESNQSNGSGGGLWANNDQTTIEDTLFHQNVSGLGGGLVISGDDADFRMSRTTVAANVSTSPLGDGGGGGIALNGTLGLALIEDSTIMGNTAVGGGGLAVLAAVEVADVVNTTFSDNLALVGGAMYVGPGDGDFSVRHTTIAYNTAEGIAASGGGIWTAHDISLDHVLVAANTAPAGNGPDIEIDGPAAITANYSFVGNNLGSGLAEGQPDPNGNLIGGPVGGGLDPGLLPLADNGGPTWTHNLLPSSLAKDAGDTGNPLLPEYDQRGPGFPRLVNDRVDIGSIELQLTDSLVVDLALDESDGDYSAGDLSLREAVEIANSTTPAERISFAESLWDQVLMLSLGELLLESSLSLTGPGANRLTLQGNGASRLLRVDDGEGAALAEVSISGLSLIDGQADQGGAIHSVEDLTLREVVLSSNSATGHGGAVFASGLLTIEASTLADNTAGDDGGALYLDTATLQLTNSTLSANRADGHGGGVYVSGSSEAVVQFSTIVSNVADNDSDGIGTGGGLFAGNSLALSHTLIAQNQDHTGAAPDLSVEADSLTSVQFNLIGDNSGSPLAEAAPDANGNIVGGPVGGAVDPLITELTQLGGTTPIHGLSLLSPAVNAGSPMPVGIPATDQRGDPYARQFGAVPDIGAYEQQTTTYTVDLYVDEDDEVTQPGELSLREALRLANRNVGDDRIEFADNFTSQTLELGPLEITDAVVIDATNRTAGLLNLTGRVFHIANPAMVIDVTLIGLRLSGTVSVGDGGAVWSSEPLTIRNTGIYDSAARAGRGGAIYQSGAALLVENSSISGNTASYGGGIYMGNGGSLNVVGATLTDNVALADGGAIWSGVELSVQATNIAGNSASNGHGGGIHQVGAPLRIDDSSVIDNSASQGGGADIAASSVDIVQSTWSGNRARVNGGAIHHDGAALVIDLSTVTLNVAGEQDLTGKGGGVYSTSSVQLRDSIVAANSRGGALPSDLFVVDSMVQAAYSLIGDNDGSGLIEASPDGNGNIVGGPVGGRIDPDLKPVQQAGNGTWYHEPRTSSPARNAADPDRLDLPEFDQRGMFNRRVVDGRLDMGAIEAQYLPIDFNLDNVLDCADIDALTAAIVSLNPDLRFDINTDGQVDIVDGTLWLAIAGEELLPSGRAFQQGDANLDGLVDVSDFNRWNDHKFTSTPAFCSGDFNMDGVVDVSDFGFWNSNKFTTALLRKPAEQPVVHQTDRWQTDRWQTDRWQSPHFLETEQAATEGSVDLAGSVSDFLVGRANPIHQNTKSMAWGISKDIIGRARSRADGEDVGTGVKQEDKWLLGQSVEWVGLEHARL